MNFAATTRSAEVEKLIREVNPGSEALEYLMQQSPDEDSLIRVLTLMRTIEIDQAQQERATSVTQ